MKKCFLAIFLSLVVSIGFAQFENLNKRKPWEAPKQKWDLRNKLLQIPPVKMQQNYSLTPMPVLKIGLDKKLIATLNNGNDQYVVNGYNMPCISPAKSYKSNMPILTATPLENPKAPEELKGEGSK